MRSRPSLTIYVPTRRPLSPGLTFPSTGATSIFGRKPVDLGLRDKVVVVTGGGSGIGEAITRLCVHEGATVVVVSRTTDHVSTFLAEMKQAQQRCDFFEADLGDLGQCKDAIHYVEQRYGALIGLVNNAGV